MDRCPKCPGTNQCVQPDGRDDCDVWFYGEAPGKDENKPPPKGGRPFVGKTGDEVNQHYLGLAGLRRGQVRFDNVISCMPTSSGSKLKPDRRADLELLDSCATHHVYARIEGARPQVLVPLGAFACRALVPHVNLELGHGIPTHTRWGIPAYPQYHPALGIYEPKKMLMIRNDWIRLKQYLNGTLILPVDPYPEPDYAEVIDAEEIDALDPAQPLGCDTEYHRKRGPYCLTYSQSPGTGRLIRAERHDLLVAFQRQLDHWRAPLLFHNWLADAPVTAAMGLRIPHRRVVDTMVAVYHLGNLPQGLKALAYREMGIVMQEFEDLVTPYSTERCLDYLMRASLIDWPKPEEQLIRGDDMQWTIYKPQSMNTKLKRFFTDYTKSDGELNVFERWDNWEAEQAAIEAECGEWPGLDIGHVPFEEVKIYAIRDADMCLRLYGLIQYMRRRVRRVSQDRWNENFTV